MSDDDSDSVAKQWPSVHFLAQESEECHPRHGAFACGPPVRDDTSVTSVTSHPEDTTFREDDPAALKSSRPSHKDSDDDDDYDDDDEDSLAEQWTRARRESEHRRRSNNPHRNNDCHNDETSVTSFTSNHGEEPEANEARLVPPSFQALVDSGVISFPSNLERGTAHGQENLVVALPVHPKDDDAAPEYPAAVEYDPDAKLADAAATKSRKWLYVAWACCAAVLAAVSIAVGVVVAGNDNDVDDDLHPREQIGIRQEILTLVPDETVLQNPYSPYSKAMKWITFEDPLQLTPHDDHFLQRYIMAYFYHATTEKRPWKICNPLQNTTESPACSYLQLTAVVSREDFDMSPSPAWGSRWLSEKHECEWAEVGCNQAMQVESIRLGKSLVRHEQGIPKLL